MPQPARAWSVGVGHRGQRVPLATFVTAVGKSSRQPSMRRKALLQLLPLAWPPKLRGPGGASALFSVMNVVVAGPV